MEASVSFGIEIEQSEPHKKKARDVDQPFNQRPARYSCCECLLGFFEEACNPDEDHGAYKGHDDGANQTAARP